MDFFETLLKLPAMLRAIFHSQRKIMADLTNLQAAVAANTAAVDAAVAKLGTLPPDQQPEIDALSVQVAADAQRLQNAAA